MEFSTLGQPRNGVVFMLCLSVGLVGLSLYHLWQGSTPEIIPVIMLIASLTLVTGFSVALYRIKPLYRITVVMLDGSAVTLLRRQKSVAVELLDGLTDAMDWHRSGSIETDTQRTSHVRQGVAQGRQQQSRTQSRTQLSTTARTPFRNTGSVLPAARHNTSQAQSRMPWWKSSRRCSDAQRCKAGQALMRWTSLVRSKRADAARPAQTPSELSTDNAQARQASCKSTGPVVAMKEVTPGARLKALLGRLKALFC